MYAVFDYTVKNDGKAIVVKSGGKEDVTNDFLRVAAEQWPHLVQEGYIEVEDSGEENDAD